MLYLLHDELIPGLEGRDPKTAEALRVLLRRAGEGKHLLLAGRPAQTAVNRWAGAEPLDSTQRGAVHQLSRDVKNAAGYMAQLSVRVEVGPDSWSRGWVDERRAAFRLPVHEIEEMDNAAPTALITEGDADGLVYVKAAEALRHRERDQWHALRLSLRPVLGAGKQIGAVLTRESAGRAPALCIVDHDGDALHRPPAPGSTRAAALDALRSCLGPAGVHTIPGKEIENLLPRVLLQEVLTASGSMSPSLSERWRGWEACGALFPSEAGRFTQLKDQLPARAASDAAAHLHRLTPQKASELLFSEDDGSWSQIARLALAWGAASPKVVQS